MAMYPENTKTLKKGESRLSLGMEIANTFVNTQGPTSQITKKETSRGIILSDFLDSEGNVVGIVYGFLESTSGKRVTGQQTGTSFASISDVWETLKSGEDTTFK